MSSTADVDMKLLTKYTFLSLALTSIALAIITSEQLQNPIDYSESKSYIRSMLTYFGEDGVTRREDTSWSSSLCIFLTLSALIQAFPMDRIILVQ